jgi:hypothetical protein
MHRRTSSTSRSLLTTANYGERTYGLRDRSLDTNNRELNLAFSIRAIEAKEITSGVRAPAHSLTPWARVTGSRLTYPVADVQSRQSGSLAY